MHEIEKIKSRLSLGDRVVFKHKDGSLSGRVRALNPKRAEVLCASGSGCESHESWLVPYGLLEIQSDKNHHDTERAALDMARELMDRHGLAGWRLKLDDVVGRAAQCRYDTKTVSLTRLYVRKAETDELKDAVLHEIAHALAGREHNHDRLWKKIALGIGCTARRCSGVRFALARWLQQCPKGCVPPREAQIRRRNLVCPHCRSSVIYKRNPVLA